MMFKISMKGIIFIGILIFLLCSCTDSYNATSENYTEQCKRLIGETDQWKIFQINDTIAVCLPSLNADQKSQPVVIRLKEI